MVLVSKIGNLKVVSCYFSFPLSSYLSFILSSHLLFSILILLSYSLRCFGVGPPPRNAFSLAVILSYSHRCSGVIPPLIILKVSSLTIWKVSTVVTINPFFSDEEVPVISIFGVFLQIFLFRLFVLT